MGVEWFYVVEGKEVGPVSSAELRSLADAGTVTPGTFVRRGTSGQWVEAALVGGLFRASGSEPAQPPPLASAEDSEREPEGRGAGGILSAAWSWLGRMKRRVSERLVPTLLVASVVMLAVSLLLQSIMCWTMLRLANGTVSGPIPVEVENAYYNAIPVNIDGHSMITPLPVEVQNSSYDAIPVEVENSSSDAIPVEVENASYNAIPVRIKE